VGEGGVDQLEIDGARLLDHVGIKDPRGRSG
jgi:hypothetical protein